MGSGSREAAGCCRWFCRPSGTGSFLLALTPDLRPGLLSVVPPGLLKSDFSFGNFHRVFSVRVTGDLDGVGRIEVAGN